MRRSARPVAGSPAFPVWTGSAFLGGQVDLGLSIAYAGSPAVAAVGGAASFAVSRSGGSAPVTYEILSGALPDGLSLNTNTGAITGTYGASGSFSAVIRATDAEAATAEASFDVIVSPQLAPLFTSGGYWANEWPM